MRERIAFLLIVLSLGVYACAQEGTVEHGWTDKNNAEMYAGYMLQHAYYEQGYWEAKVEIRQAGTKRVFVVQPGRIYRVERFDVSGLGDLPEEAMADSPKAGDVYSPARVNEWIATIEKRYARRAVWGVESDRAHAQMMIEVQWEGGPNPLFNDRRP
jgi:outer membrane protein assembly factor BamA